MNAFRSGWLWLVLTGVLAHPGAAQLPNLPRLAVSFEITAPSYLSKYTPAQRTMIQDSAARMLARKLTERFGFARFVTGGNAPHTLHFALANSDATNPSRMSEVGIAVQLRGDSPPPSPPYYWRRFRLAEHADLPPGSPATLLANLDVATDHSNWEVLVGRLLSRVAVATRATLVRPPMSPRIGWALPFSRTDLCIGRDSRVEVANDLTVGVQFIPDARYEGLADREFGAGAGAPLAGKLLIYPGANSRYLAELGTANTISLKGVYVTRYKRHQSGCETIQRASPGRSR